MILTASFLICKALGVTWSWWWMLATVCADYSFRDDFQFRFKITEQ